MRRPDQAELPGFEAELGEGLQDSPPPVWDIEVFRMELPAGFYVVARLEVYNTAHRREGEGEVQNSPL
jgi:hypothetical protein